MTSDERQLLIAVAKLVDRIAWEAREHDPGDYWRDHTKHSALWKLIERLETPEPPDETHKPAVSNWGREGAPDEAA